MSELAVVRAVASTLYHELGLGDLDSFIDAFRNYRHDVIAALESDACRVAAAAAAVEPPQASTLADATMKVQVQVLCSELRSMETEVVD